MIIHTYDMFIFEEFEIFFRQPKLSNVGHLLTITHKFPFQPHLLRLVFGSVQYVVCTVKTRIRESIF